MIFLSHANPDDNDFVLWLGGRLAAAGYEVWSDITKLIGGELFWDRIETAIRRDTAVFVSVVSGASVKKRGFLNEMSVACAEEAKRGRDDFVIPLKLDGIPYSEFPVLLHRKNAIDFNKGWDKGLKQLLEKLRILGLKTKPDAGSREVRAWSEEFFGFSRGVVADEELLGTNWLECVSAPRTVYVIQCHHTPNPNQLFAPHVWPLVRFRDHLVSFTSPNTLGLASELTEGHHSEVALDAVSTGNARFLSGAQKEAGKGIIASLVRRSWERLASEKGLAGFRLANRRYAWYLPLSGAEIAWVDYKGLDGTSRRKRLIGKSERQRVFWHAAIEGVPLVDTELRLVIVMHVVFTRDGQTPIGDAALMHRLRRRFCKNWWQGQWRDLQLAFLVFLTSDGGNLLLPYGPKQYIEMSRTPIQILFPVTYQEGEFRQTEKLDSEYELLETVDAVDEDESDFWAGEELSLFSDGEFVEKGSE